MPVTFDIMPPEEPFWLLLLEPLLRPWLEPELERDCDLLPDRLDELEPPPLLERELLRLLLPPPDFEPPLEPLRPLLAELLLLLLLLPPPLELPLEDCEREPEEEPPRDLVDFFCVAMVVLTSVWRG
jgi:hypothetical protein